MKVLKHIINAVIWTLLGLYALLMVAVRLPYVQHQLGEKVSEAIGAKLGTKVKVGRVDVGFLNRIILDDVLIYDQRHKPMVKAARLTAKIEMSPLALGKVSVSSAQFFGTQFHLTRLTANAPANFQFVLDSLASDDSTSRSPLNLRVNSFIVRHSSVTYDQWDAPVTPERLNPRHLNFIDISAYISLKALREDTVSVNVKRLTFLEQSGLRVNRLVFQMNGGRHRADLRNFLLQMPDTEIHIDSLGATYDIDHVQETLQAEGNIAQTTAVTPSDFRWLLPQLKNYQHPIAVKTSFKYQHQTLTIPDLQLASATNDLVLRAAGSLTLNQQGRYSWNVRVDDLKIGETAIDFVSKNFVALPAPLMRIGDVWLKGNFSSDVLGTLSAQADITTGIGHVDAKVKMSADKQFAGTVMTEGINLGQLLDHQQLGTLEANVSVNGIADNDLSAKGHVERLEYDGYTYKNIELDGHYTPQHLAGQVSISDPRVAAQLEMDIHGHNVNDAVGVVSLRHLSLPEKDYRLNFLRLESGFDDDRHFVTMNSDFAHVRLDGEFDYATLAQSVANAVGHRLPTLPGMPPVTQATANNFALKLNLGKTDWLQKLLDVDLVISQPLYLSATVNDANRQLMVDLNAPSFTFNDTRYKQAHVCIDTPSDTLLLQAALSIEEDNGLPLDLRVNGNAADNNLNFALHWNNNNPEKPVSGVLNASAQLYQDFAGKSEAHVRILPSEAVIDNSLWEIEPSDILYSTERLLVDHFLVHNNNQQIGINGTASESPNDSIVVDLEQVEVAYILDLVSFDAVTFSGKVSGKAYLTSAFDNPDANAVLRVSDFKFQDGRMGTLAANVSWNKKEKQIDIHATANDGPDAMTYINGYVSLEKEAIDLDISAHGTYLDFMHSFTKSFISHITGHGTGAVRLAGPLSAINLTGGLVVSGEATITPLNTSYQLRQDTLTLVYNEIMLNRQPIYDSDNNVAYLSGAIHHEDLTNLSLDLHVTTDKFLGYDFRDFVDQSFYGTVYASGEVDISMKGDDVNINCRVTPLKNTVFVYNAAQAEAITNQEFITWKHATQDATAQGTPNTTNGTDTGSGTNIYMTFIINTSPDATMRLFMDAKTNDYITLNGSGTIQASYYNKGSFQMQGTYTVESGTYDVTIQNIINKKFLLQQGGTIIFAGDPYSAALNLQALYTVNGVSLTDLQLGNSFSSNTVRVNCLMNIGGQSSAPQVTFDLDLPNVNADEKQMVRSLLSSQQEMNQQVLYLLGIGRFYSQGRNNASEQEQQGQTSLAMQSFLSGTLSTQINNVISQIVKNENWNFGANISTGTEGWNNAEYEGIINGRMLNNRLLINGQFGYRDKATQATPSFIGDFDVRYLLNPNGNLALKVYNQTNDRYFTRSSLNTQGVGLIMKRDFNGFSDFFGIKRK